MKAQTSASVTNETLVSQQLGIKHEGAGRESWLLPSVYLRSSNHKLPGLVFDLHGIVDVEASARIDSIHGGIRTSFEGVPDAPVSKVVLDMQGARKGLIVNSTDLCSHNHSADVLLGAHNGKQLSTKVAGLRAVVGVGAALSTPPAFT